MNEATSSLTRAGSATWENLGAAFTDLLSYSKLPPSTKNKLHDEELFAMDKQSAGLTFISLSQLAYQKYALAVKNKNVVVPGLTIKLEALDRRRNQKKIKYLESETAIDEAWRENCDNDDLAKQYIDEGLKFFDLEMFWGLEKPQRLQEAFADEATTPLQLMSLWIKSYPGSMLMLRCNVYPRNERWMPQILTALESDGPPVLAAVRNRANMVF